MANEEIKSHSPVIETPYRGNGKKKFGDVSYTTKTIIKRLRKHMIDNMKSKYTMIKPTIQTIRTRIAEGDLELKQAMIEIEAEHCGLYEEMLVEGLQGKRDVDSKLFRIATQNKKPFLSPEQMMIAEGIAPAVAPQAPQLHFHQISTREEFEKLEHWDRDSDI